MTKRGAQHQHHRSPRRFQPQRWNADQLALAGSRVESGAAGDHAL